MNSRVFIRFRNHVYVLNKHPIESVQYLGLTACNNVCYVVVFMEHR